MPTQLFNFSGQGVYFGATYSYKDIYGKFDRVVSRYREVELEPINNEIKEFDLRKYVDIHADKNKEQNFLKQIAEI